MLPSPYPPLAECNCSNVGFLGGFVCLVQRFFFSVLFLLGTFAGFFWGGFIDSQFGVFLFFWLFWFLSKNYKTVHLIIQDSLTFLKALQICIFQCLSTFPNFVKGIVCPQKAFSFHTNYRIHKKRFLAYKAIHSLDFIFPSFFRIISMQTNATWT